MMQGPRDTPWEAGRFEFEIRIPLEEYPHKPPVLRFLPVITMQGHTTCCVFHPNVDERGFVCADVLATEWSSVCSIATLLLSVQSILDDPSCEHPANVNAAALLVQDRAKYIEKVRALSCATAQRGSKLSSDFSTTWRGSNPATTADFSAI
jgi:ubiquitin-protein ligase